MEQLRCREALAAHLCDCASLSAVLHNALRELDGHASRRRVKDVIIGVSVLRLRLRARVQDHQASTPEDVDALIAAFFDDHGRGIEEAIDEGGALGLSRQRSVPLWLAERLVRDLGLHGAHTFMRVQNQPGPTTLRANLRRGDRASLRRRLADVGINTRDNASSDIAVDVVGHANLFGVAPFREGAFEVQDASSQAVAAACALCEGDAVVVDLCAGRGGKTLALSAVPGFRGRIIATDVDGAALADLRGRLKRAGADNVEVVAKDDVAAVVAAVDGCDVVLVDAPCTSSGVWRRFPDRRFTTTPDELEQLSALQRELLREAACLVRPQGRVVYATCSVLADENEAVVDVFGDGRVLRCTSTRRLTPSSPDDGDGFFIACFERPAR